MLSIAFTPLLANVAEFGSKKLVPSLDFYSSKPNTKITINMESTKDLGEPFPKGRYAVYTATTTKVNQWETLNFVLESSKDAAVNPTDVDRMVILVNPGAATDNGVYYFDNLKGPTVTQFTDLAATSISSPINASVCFNKDNTIKLQIKNNSTKVINFANTRIDVYANVLGPKKQSFRTPITTGVLAANGTREVTVTTKLDLSQLGDYTIVGGVHAPGDNVCANNKAPQRNLKSQVCVGVNELEENQSIVFFPNPSSGEIYFDTKNIAVSRIELLNIQGNKIDDLTFSDKKSIVLPTEKITNGLYFLKIYTESASFIEKIELIK